jgi:hypothetical protein
MTVNNIYRGIPGDSSAQFNIGDAFTTAQNNDDSLNASKPENVNSVAALRLLDKTKISSAETKGYYTAGDGGHGKYWYDASDTTSADNGFTVIVGADGGRWKLQVLGGKYHIKQGGAVGDDSTESRPQIVAMLGALAGVGGELDTGRKGDLYKITATTSPVFTVPANVKITGSGTLNMTASTTSFFNVFNLSAGSLLLKDIAINWTTPVGSSGISLFLFGSGGSIVMDNIIVDAGVTDIGGGLLSAANHLFSIGGNASNVVIKNSKFTKFKFGILKTNASTAINKFWEFSWNKFETFYSPALTFNTPSGDWDHVKVTNNTFKDNLGGHFSAFPHMGGVAGGLGSGDFIFSGNTLTGEGQGWHFEEGATQIKIIGETIAVNDIGIQLIDNNVGGTRLTPSKFIISDNTITQTGTAFYNLGNNRGLDITWDGTGQSGIRDSIISNNIITGYDYGIKLSEDTETLIVQGNLILDCTTSISSYRLTNAIRNNTFMNANVGVESLSRGGMLGDNTFINCVTPLLDSSSLSSGCSAFSIDKRGHSLPTGVSNIGIIGLPSRIYGLLTFSLYSAEAASSRQATFEILWDGTTLTATSKCAMGAGNILTPSIINSGGVLALQLNNASGAVRSTSVEVKFSGGWLLS